MGSCYITQGAKPGALWCPRGVGWWGEGSKYTCLLRVSQVALVVKSPPANARDMGSIPWSQEDPLEKGMAAHCSILACRIPHTEELGGLWSIRSQAQLKQSSIHALLNHLVVRQELTQHCEVANIQLSIFKKEEKGRNGRRDEGEQRGGKAKREGGEGGTGQEATATAHKVRLKMMNSSRLWLSPSIQFSAFSSSILENLFNWLCVDLPFLPCSPRPSHINSQNIPFKKMALHCSIFWGSA